MAAKRTYRVVQVAKHGIVIAALLFAVPTYARTFTGTASVKFQCSDTLGVGKERSSAVININPGSGRGTALLFGTEYDVFTDQTAGGEFMMSATLGLPGPILIKGKIKKGRLKGRFLFHLVEDKCFWVGTIKAR